MYEYTAEIMSVHDGDSVTMRVDLGLDTHRWLQQTRLNGINAPELNRPEGKAARAALSALVLGKTLRVQTIKDRKEKYGRYLVDIYLEDNMTTANRWMVENGYALVYSGERRV